MRLTFFAGLRPFNRIGAVRDAFAGLTLASINITQVLGYTRIAGTPVVTGLHSAATSDYVCYLRVLAPFGGSGGLCNCGYFLQRSGKCFRE